MPEPHDHGENHIELTRRARRYVNVFPGARRFEDPQAILSGRSLQLVVLSLGLFRDRESVSRPNP